MGDTPVTDQYPALTPGNYVVSAGDTLRGIALALYGDAQLWYLIADANGLQTDAELSVGRNLTIPNKITNLRNAHDTYKPYEPGRIIGDLTPTLPNPPPPKKEGGGCGGLGRIIMLAVQLVVSYLIPGPIGAMLGNFAGQVVGNILGVQDGISWKEVAKAGLSSFIGGQLGAEGSPLAGSDFGTVVARAAISNVMTQGVSVAVGLQEKFDWKGVAAAAVGAGVSHVVGEAIGQARHGDDWDLAKQNPLSNPGAIDAKYTISQDFGGNLLRGAISNFAGGIAKHLVYGGKMNFASIAVDAFGNALGDALGQYVTGPDVKAQQLAALEEAAQQTQGIGPWSEANYRNGADIESDLAADRRQNPSGWAFADDVARRRAALGNVWGDPAAAGIDTPATSGPLQPQSYRAGDFGGSAERFARALLREQLGREPTQRETADFTPLVIEANNVTSPRRVSPDTVWVAPDAGTQASGWGAKVYRWDIAVGESIKAEANARSENSFFSCDANYSDTTSSGSDISRAISRSANVSDTLMDRLRDPSVRRFVEGAWQPIADARHELRPWDPQASRAAQAQRDGFIRYSASWGTQPVGGPLASVAFLATRDTALAGRVADDAQILDAFGVPRGPATVRMASRAVATNRVAPEGVVYLRTDRTGGIAPYGGQAKSEARFFERQTEHARAHPDADFEFTIVRRAEPGVRLDVAEHNFIQELTGGVAARKSPLVSNLKDPVGAQRRTELGLPEPRRNP